jgi:hypothetical protein
MNVPDAMPLTNWKNRTVCRSGESGRSALDSANTEAEIISTRCTPNTAPSQAETGPTSIWPTVSAVVIQAPSSKPACTAPRTSASPNEVMRLSSVEMIEPSSTASVPM